MSFLNSVLLELKGTSFSKLCLVFFIAFIVIKSIKRVIRILRLPRGPYGLPIVGYLPFLDENQSKQYVKLGQKYGSPFSIRLGMYDFVVINDRYHADKAFTNEELQARPPEGMMGGVLPSKCLFDLSGEWWKDQRRFFLSVLQQSGFNRNELEAKIKVEVDNFVDELDMKKECPFDISELIAASVSNNISILTHGKRFDYTDKARTDVIRHILGVSGSSVLLGMATVMPSLLKVLKFIGSKKYKSFIQALSNSNTFDKVKIGKDSDGYTSHYIDSFLAKMEERKRKGLSKESFNLSILEANIISLFSTGSATVFSAMSWIILLLVKYPHYQSKIREEISQVIGTRAPSYEERLSLPLTMAFMYETFRYRTNVHLTIPRYNTKDVQLGDCLIPKGTRVIINSYAVDNDPSLWSDPQKFYPERFLSDDGMEFILPSHFMPFGRGKRKCLGEILAMTSMFQYITSVLQKYTLEAYCGPENVCEEANFGYLAFPAKMPQIVAKRIHLDIFSSTTCENQQS
ncbi:cytochrome P450 2A4-like [Brevipalpus obovatus]|uniref:cytochrome P450 2A4-like n=1 Tax=Brevipalpus obovatus TaxID=246614 RepID=UPI003D9EBA91